MNIAKRLILVSDRNVHIVSEESHCSEKHEEHFEWTEQAETNHLDVHPKQEKPINTEVQTANEFAIDETLSPSVQSRIEDFIADLHKEDDEDDTSERDLIPINFKSSSRLQNYTISPHGSCSTSRCLPLDHQSFMLPIHHHLFSAARHLTPLLQSHPNLKK
ncbi:hypothetical protein G6F68_014102 [Rhizopus microsporus]|nr:hypothetical protein G6F68_014102 [Rhizopus microsporus]